MTIWTIGHSTRTFDELLEALQAYGIEVVIDVRRFPGSRRLPQFGSDVLAASLAVHDIDYRWIAALGGRRRGDPAMGGTGWRHPAFQAYAQHTRTEEFAGGLAELLDIAEGVPAAIMCAELLWWRCHRRVIADVLTSLGERVVHIRDAHNSAVHQLASPARIRRGVLTYAE